MSTLQNGRPRISSAASSLLKGAWDGVRARARWSWARERLPWVNTAAVRRRRAVILPPYRRVHTLVRELLPLALVPALGFFCLVYGFFFGLSAPYLIVPMAAPIAFLALISVWALPDLRTAPTGGIEYFFLAFLIFLLLWPNYLAISLPGLPWITTARLTGFPMVALLLISLSVSKKFAQEVARSVTTIKPMWYALSAFWILQFLSIGVSASPNSSAQLVFNYFVNYTCVFVISCVIFRKIEFVERYWGLLAFIAVPLALVTYREFHESRVLWAGHLPPFLQIPGETVWRLLSPLFRPGTNVYRAKAIFDTPLVLAEYLGLLTPLFLHFATTSRPVILRVAAAAMIPVCFVTIRMTDSRLGLVAMLISILLFGVAWAYRQWRSQPQSLLSTAMLFSAPVAFLGGIGLVMASNRLNTMVFGGEAQAGSNAARQNQLSMAFQHYWERPWGYGPGQSGHAMGYGEGEFITIDNYFIALLLDYGLLGVFLWYSAFILGIVWAVRYGLFGKQVNEPEARLLMPLAVLLTAFLVIKWVHGQQDIHTLEFMYLGMISALVFRLKSRFGKDAA